MASVFPDSLLLLKLNPIEPPWYGPVCPVVWEGRRREVSPYPDLGAWAVIAVDGSERPQWGMRTRSRGQG
jgi:hypothetical protein